MLSTRVVVMSARPGRISHVVEIDLPSRATEDTRETERYFELVTEVRESTARGEREEAAGRGWQRADGRELARAPRSRASADGRGMTASAPARPSTPSGSGVTSAAARRVRDYVPPIAVFVVVIG